MNENETKEKEEQDDDVIIDDFTKILRELEQETKQVKG